VGAAPLLALLTTPDISIKRSLMLFHNTFVTEAVDLLLAYTTEVT